MALHLENCIERLKKTRQDKIKRKDKRRESLAIGSTQISKKKEEGVLKQTKASLGSNGKDLTSVW